MLNYYIRFLKTFHGFHSMGDFVELPDSLWMYCKSEIWCPFLDQT